MYKSTSTLLLFLLYSVMAFAQDDSSYWTIHESAIQWDLKNETRLPHKENIEMSGKKVSAILYYEIDEQKNIKVDRDLIYPQLRTFVKSNEPAWKKYRAYFKRTIGDENLPLLTVEESTIVPGPVAKLEIEGNLSITHEPQKGLEIVRSFYPSMEQRHFVEQWTITNADSLPKEIILSPSSFSQYEKGFKGKYGMHVFVEGNSKQILQPNEKYSIAINYVATLNEEPAMALQWKDAKEQRTAFLKKIKEHLVLKSNDEVLNQLFYFSKIRAAESIFHSSMGLVHSPGGGNYYLGIWANDQIEYSGPFFPFLNYKVGKTAAYNAYKMFLQNIPSDDQHIPYAFEVDGNFPMRHLDRGDAAMISYGTSKFLLAMGDQKLKEELWPLVEWSLAYCERQKNEEGAIQSASDEMEGRIPTGTANLSTNSLYYGGLKFAKEVAKDLKKSDLVIQYEKEERRMEEVIENYFGSNIDGLHTYKYFKENTYLRHWICLPLCMGIQTRKAATLEALFSKLWTKEGILVELNPENTQKVFWDRATLYALRGAFKAQAPELAFDKLKAYSEKRLLGDHVPYPVEAYPENNMKHLSAESALYCRIFTEGILGLELLSNKQLKLQPSFPTDWDSFSLEKIDLFGKPYDLIFTKKSGKWFVDIKGEKGTIRKNFKKSSSVFISM